MIGAVRWMIVSDESIVRWRDCWGCDFVISTEWNDKQVCLFLLLATYLVSNETADVEGKREDARKQHHLRRGSHRQLFPTTHNLRHLPGGETHQAYLQQSKGTHLGQQIDLVHLEIALQITRGHEGVIVLDGWVNDNENEKVFVC